MFRTILLLSLLFQFETFAQTTSAGAPPFLLVPGRWENKALIFVNKKIRKLFVFKVQQGKPVSIFETDVDFGKSDGNKTRRNDHKTPEGIYFPQTHLTPPAIPFNMYGNRAFTLDYPNVIDQTEGKTGDGIWIHSVPDNVPLTRGSKGCVVVRNESIDQLKSMITLKDTPVVIETEDEAAQIKADEEKQELSQFLDSWKQTWASKDLDKYIEFYSDSFKAPGYNRRTWKEYKSHVNDGAGQIEIGMEEMSAIKASNQFLVTFVQKYKSDKLQDVGIKTMWIKKESSGFKIIREEWAPQSPNSLAGLSEASPEINN